jgi:hypothetical protein
MADPLLAASRELGIDTSPGDMQFLTAPPRSSATTNPMDRLRQQERWRTLQQGSIDRGMALREQMSTFDEQNLRGEERAQRVRDMRFGESEREREVGRRDRIEGQGQELIGAIQRGEDPLKAAMANPAGLLDPEAQGIANLQLRERAMAMEEERQDRFVRSRENSAYIQQAFDIARRTVEETGIAHLEVKAQEHLDAYLAAGVEPRRAALMVSRDMEEIRVNAAAEITLAEAGMTDEEIASAKIDAGLDVDAPIDPTSLRKMYNRYRLGAGADRMALQQAEALRQRAIEEKTIAEARAEGTATGQAAVPRGASIDQLRGLLESGVLDDREDSNLIARIKDRIKRDALSSSVRRGGVNDLIDSAVGGDEIVGDIIGGAGLE